MCCPRFVGIRSSGGETLNILMLLNKDYHTDPRVWKELLSFSRKGEHEVRMISNRHKINTKHKVRFILNLISFYLYGLSVARIRSRYWGIDAIHAHDLDTLPLGILLARLHDLPLIYDAHEVYAYMIADDVSHGLRRLVYAVERRLTRRCTHVITVSRNVAYAVSEHPEDCVLVMNCPGDLPPITPAPYKKGALWLGYFGALEPGRFILEAIEAVEATPEWEIVIAGSGTLEDRIRARNTTRVHFLGQLPHERAIQEMGTCDLQLLMFDPNNANSSIGMPNRLFEAMWLSKPVVATYYTDSGSLVRDIDCGFECGYGVSALSTLLKYLAKHPEELPLRGQKAYLAWEREYNWAHQERNLFELYGGLYE